MSTSSPSTAFEASHTPLELDKYVRPYEVHRVELLQSLMPQGHGGRALDIGAGPGFFSATLASRGWRVTAIDTDAHNIDRARPHVETALLGDALTMLGGMDRASFELALALEIIEHMPRNLGERLMAEAYRVLRPGGRLLLSTPNRHSPQGLGGYYWSEKIRRAGRWTAWDDTHVQVYSAPEVLAMLRYHGFRIHEVVGYYYQGVLPVVGAWRLPLVSSRSFPLNRLGFNLMVVAERD